MSLHFPSTCASCRFQPWGQRSWRKQEANTHSLLSADQLCGQHCQVCVWGTIMSVFNLFGLFHAKAANSCVVMCGPVFVCSRYLESCTGPALKRKSDSHSLATSSSSSSTSEDDKPAGATDTAQTSSDGINIPHSLQPGYHVAIFIEKKHHSVLLISFVLIFQWCWTVGYRWPLQQQQLLERLWQTSPCPPRPWV